MHPTIRIALPQDGADAARIYAPSVEGSAVSFEETAPSASDMAARIERLTRTHPWLCAVSDDRVLGYAYASPHRDRPAYRWAVEVSAYVHPDARRQRLGASLYRALFEVLRIQRFAVAYAGITLPNDQSVGFHESMGFTHLATYDGIGWKLGAWRDVGWWQLRLTDNDASPPQDPIPFDTLRDDPRIQRALNDHI